MTIPAAPDAWARVRTALCAELGADAFKNWIDPVQYIGSDPGVVQLGVPTMFHGNWVQRNYSETIRRLMCKAGVTVSRIEVAVVQADAPPVRGDAGGGAGGGNGGTRASGLGDRRTLHLRHFVVGKPNELAHAAARRVAEGVAERGRSPSIRCFSMAASASARPT